MKPERQQFLALKWLIESAGDKNNRVRIWDTLSSELLSAYNNEVQSCMNITCIDIVSQTKIHYTNLSQ